MVRWWWAYLLGFLLFTIGVPSHELRAFGNASAIATFAASALTAAGLVRLMSLRRPRAKVDDSAFAPGDILSLN